MKSLSRGTQSSWGPVVIAVAAGVLVLTSALLVNGCRISRLLSPANGPPGSPGGGDVIIVIPSLVRDSAIAGASEPRVTNLSVTNGSGWTATTDDPWIRLTPTSGGSRANVRLSLDPEDLSPGLHEGMVTLEEHKTDGASATVAVRFLIQQPILEVKPDKFDFRPRTGSAVFRDTLSITNKGTGPLVWTATTEHRARWLRFESDTAGTGPGILALRASNEGLSFFGTFRETVIISSAGAKNSPQRIEVTMRRRHGGDDDDDDDDAPIP